MNTCMKKWLIVAASLVILGLIIFAVAMTALGWDITKLSTVKLETAEHVIEDDFNGITVKTDTSDIVFLPSVDGKTKIVCYEKENERHEVKVKDGVLEIIQKDDKAWYEYIGINFSSPKITVYLPKNEYGALKIRSKTGDIKIPKDIKLESADISLSTGDVRCYASVLGEVKIKASTGSIYVKDVSVGALDVSVSTGDINVSEVGCAGDIKTKSSTGDVEMKNVTCNNLTSKGSTGDIELENVIASGKLSIERSTGDVELDGCDAVEIFITTDTGDVEGTLLSEKQFIVKSDTGERKYPNTANGGRCEITTDTGDIEIRLAS